MAKKRPQKDKEKEKIKDGEPKGISGLLNLGNSCYLNSILQCLFHLPEIILYMNSQKLNEDLEYNKNINVLLSDKDKERLELHYKLVTEFEKLLKQIWKGYSIKDLIKLLKKNNQNDITDTNNEEDKSRNNNNINISNNNSKYYLEPREFKKILSEIFPQFEGYYQQDAHEVLTSILDSFHLALNKSFNEGGLLISSSINDNNLLLLKTQSFIADASHKAVNDSFIEDTFFGQLSSIFTCYKCHEKINVTYEPFSSLELTIPIEKTINLYILSLNPNNKEQVKLNININDNMSYYDLYDQVSKIAGISFENYVFYWPNEKRKTENNKKTRNLRSSKNKNNGNKNSLNIYDNNEDIIINECNIDKCQNYISCKTNELILMENYNIKNFFTEDILEIPYEYYLEIKIVNNNKTNNNSHNLNCQDNIPRVFKVYLSETGDDHLIYNYLYQYLELFTEEEKMKKKLRNSQNSNVGINPNKSVSLSSSTKIKNKKQNLKKDVNKLFLEDVRKYAMKHSNNNNNINNNCILLEEEKEITHEKKYILGVICKNSSIDNNNNYEMVCPLCNKKSKKINDENCECFCINNLFDNELKIKNKELKRNLTTQLINFIEKNISTQKSLLSIRVHPYSNFSFLKFNKFFMYTVKPITTNVPKSKKKIPRQQNLLELFESFAAEEKIENECVCDKCGNINYTYQKKDIHKFPQILIIHIKRFKNEIEKNEEKIVFPEDIDLSKYNNKGQSGKYSLNSVVFHQGTLISGHYTAIFKYLPTNQWLFCNDTKVKFLSGDKIMGLNPAYNKDDVSAIGDGYILFYRKYD